MRIARAAWLQAAKKEGCLHLLHGSKKEVRSEKRRPPAFFARQQKRSAYPSSPLI
jgi:hypothetical protein